MAPLKQEIVSPKLGMALPKHAMVHMKLSITLLKLAMVNVLDVFDVLLTVLDSLVYSASKVEPCSRMHWDIGCPTLAMGTRKWQWLA